MALLDEAKRLVSNTHFFWDQIAPSDANPLQISYGFIGAFGAPNYYSQIGIASFFSAFSPLEAPVADALIEIRSKPIKADQRGRSKLNCREDIPIVAKGSE